MFKEENLNGKCIFLNFLCIEMIVKLLKFIFENSFTNKFMVLLFIKNLKIKIYG